MKAAKNKVWLMLAARALLVLMVALKLWQLFSHVHQRQRRQRLERCWVL